MNCNKTIVMIVLFTLLLINITLLIDDNEMISKDLSNKNDVVVFYSGEILDQHLNKCLVVSGFIDVPNETFYDTSTDFNRFIELIKNETISKNQMTENCVKNGQLNLISFSIIK